MTTEEEDEVIAKLSDYLDGAKDGRAEIEAKLASDPDWKRLHDEMVDSQDAAKQLSGLRKVGGDAVYCFDDPVPGLSSLLTGIGKRVWPSRPRPR